MTDKFIPIPPRAHSDVPFSRPATPGAHPIQIGWVGLGSMGYLMARNLAKYHAAHPPSSSLLVWNRSHDKSEKLVREVGESKVRIAQNIAEIATHCDVIITSLASDAVVKSIYEEFAEALHQSPPTKNKIFLESSTIYPTLAGELDNIISSLPHCHLVTAPVFGPPKMAENASLLLAMSGDYRSKKEAAYLLVPAIARKVYDLGGNLEKVLGCMEVLAEAFTMGEKSVVDIAHSMVSYGDKMLNDKFDGTKGFSIDGGIKDASHIRHLTTEHNAPMPTIDAAHRHLLTARALHTSQARTGSTQYPVLDWSAIVAGARTSAGIDGLDSKNTTYSGPVKDDE
ncbi:hypothetical protein EW146_g867 [Bondarzewia mesenterica]|uniref:6-phosphogluconate dehydrogenase NADP-binding domain-containing protein n=1 Tax=Bondarzewia mesenterica TaxID=1095465 RepID=A0A4S4M708_9AGAM|nr:hypothetical protein EW146_g867 [Bondarzewia mesenterica]